MWIVRLALDRPYTFIVLALLILIMGPVMILSTPTDIFPNINIPVIAVAWTYSGLNAEDVEARLTTPYEKVLTTLVDNIQHIESTSYNGEAIVKIFLQPDSSLDNRERSGRCRGWICSALSAAGHSATGDHQLQRFQCADSATGCFRPRAVRATTKRPFPQLFAHTAHYGSWRGDTPSLWGKAASGHDQHESEPDAGKGVSPSDVLNAVNAQNLILPSGTAKVAESELDVRMNVYPRTVAELNDIPIKQVGNTTWPYSAD